MTPMFGPEVIAAGQMARRWAVALLVAVLVQPAVATENAIRHELSCEVSNRVIIPPHAGDGRTAVALAGVAREIATPARS
jgi:hypothetical protein